MVPVMCDGLRKFDWWQIWKGERNQFKEILKFAVIMF
jgi:hypothetical protein